MPITEQQRAERIAYVGSSDARKLMAGQWLELWQQKTGRRGDDDLRQNVLVQIGIATEPLHRQFYEWKTGAQVVAVPETQRMMAHPHICANLDYGTFTHPQHAEQWDTPMEAKFNAGFASLADVIEYNFWQIQHQLLVTGCGQAVLSLIQPRQDGYSFAVIARDEARIVQLEETIHAFWWYVEQDEAPSQQDPVASPTVARQKILDMSLNNSFVSLATVILEHRLAVQASKNAESDLKGTMPEDAQLAYLPPRDGNPGLVLSRDKAGKISLKIGDLPRIHAARSTLWLPDGTSYDQAGE